MVLFSFKETFRDYLTIVCLSLIHTPILKQTVCVLQVLCFQYLIWQFLYYPKQISDAFHQYY